jgi:hypothetical protein
MPSVGLAIIIKMNKNISALSSVNDMNCNSDYIWMDKQPLYNEYQKTAVIIYHAVEHAC